jgi:hypothetical protein
MALWFAPVPEDRLSLQQLRPYIGFEWQSQKHQATSFRLYENPVRSCLQHGVLNESFAFHAFLIVALLGHPRGQ